MPQQELQTAADSKRKVLESGKRKGWGGDVLFFIYVCMYAWMDGWIDGWMDGWMDGRMHACTNIIRPHTYVNSSCM